MNLFDRYDPSGWRDLMEMQDFDDSSSLVTPRSSLGRGDLSVMATAICETPTVRATKHMLLEPSPTRSAKCISPPIDLATPPQVKSPLRLHADSPSADSDDKLRSSLALVYQLRDHAFDLDAAIRESFARAASLSAACQGSQKRCSYQHCTNIAVSRGLCRGHGGGRRCQLAGCTKSAQSRSNFCWAHGGGQRCDFQGCMRSRKSKRFCSAHLQFDEQSGEVSSRRSPLARPAVAIRRQTRNEPCNQQASAQGNGLPRLRQALRAASLAAPKLPALRPQATRFKG